MSLHLWNEDDFKDLAHILEIIKEKSSKVNDVDELQELDELLHNMLLSRCDNEQLIQMSRLSCSNISKFLCYSYWRAISDPAHFYERHKTIVEAIFTKNHEIIRKAIHDHYNEIAEIISKHVEKTIKS